MNVWGTFPGKPSGDFVFKKALKGSPDWQTVTIKPGDMLKKDSSDPLPSWETVTELNLTRPATCLVDGKEVEFGKGWETPIELRNMRWEGGEVVQRSKPYQREDHGDPKKGGHK